MALPCALGLGLLLALPGALGSGGTEASGGSGSSVVVLLSLFLLLLVIGLALAWYRLIRDSGGHYHPVRLGAALWGRARRLLWASPPGRWLRGRAKLGSEDNDPERQEDDAENDIDDIVAGGPEEAEPREEQWRAEGPGPESAGETRDGDGSLGLSIRGPAGAGGSAEALLSDLHAFAGSAAWDDSARATGGQGLHVTAL
ncbi:protein tyrosine phosphatase receptor type C-associated protein [Choloepus didactylus]|uniref:protein tyrosine phosphatase receptor type C-associated protein n=1 Tax=Choloepus didactylus TaxID=27675 RepID=UPI0018A054DD|nr:protein tyrosine phosphatase receptor type C-associated protein [Choloepus didactylus]